MSEFHSCLVPPQGTWWLPVPAQEKRWITISFAWCLILFAMMPLWHLKGGQNPSGVRGKVDPAEYGARVDRFIAENKVGEENGFPVVAPKPGADVYIRAQQYMWTPVVKLQEGVEYTIHLSSTDVNHGFSLYPTNLNLQVVPGYDYALKMTPNKAGEYRIICNEFCGIGHHIMAGKVVVEAAKSTAAVESGVNP